MPSTFADIVITWILVLAIAIVSFLFMLKLTKDINSVKTEIFTLRTAIQSNSCFHLELPPTDEGSKQWKNGG